MLLDSSAWIYYLNRAHLNHEQLQQICISPPIIQEVLQGIKDERAHERVKNGLLAMPCLGSPLSLDTFLEAAEIFRIGRKKGKTIRATIDCLIAAVAIKAKVPVMHRDRDFDEIAKFTALMITPQW